MKNIIYVILIVFIIACDEDSVDKVDNSQLPYSLNGEWVLQSISCFCPLKVDYKKSQIWTFDTLNSTINIKNLKELEDDLSYEEGDYIYELNENVIHIKDNRSFLLTIKNNALQIGTSVADDVQMDFVRSE